MYSCNLLYCSYDLLAKEKDALEAEFRDYRQQIEMSRDDTAAKELRMLRAMVRSLEEERQASQAKHQRLMMKRSKQCRLLIDEVRNICKQEPYFMARNPGQL